jgi:putative transposase
MDFVNDSIAFSRKAKILTVLDPVTNVSLVIKTDSSITGKDVVDTIQRVCDDQGYPDFIQCDNGPEFRSKELDQWCYENNIRRIFFRTGKPTDNCHIESFNGTFEMNA